MFEISYLWGLAGGLLIGLGAAVYLLGNGRIMGASGIFGGLIDGSAGSQWSERAMFLVGLIGAPALVIAATGFEVATNITSNIAVIAIAGILVGLGTRIGNGCTSGHGVCGISRLSLRGIVATLIYLGAGMVTVLVFKNILGMI